LSVTGPPSIALVLKSATLISGLPPAVMTPEFTTRLEQDAFQMPTETLIGGSGRRAVRLCGWILS
jgi:hypothetical protein